MPKIKGIKECMMWACFAPDGNIQVRSLAYTKKDAEAQLCDTPFHQGVFSDYSSQGYTTNKVIVDIKIK